MRTDPTNTDILEAIQEFATTTDKRFDLLTIQVVNLKEDNKEIKARLDKLEQTVNRVFLKIDEFIGIIKKQEVELVALRSHVQRLEKRLVRLEMAQGISPS